jgi:hypothetical protein
MSSNISQKLAGNENNTMKVISVIYFSSSATRKKIAEAVANGAAVDATRTHAQLEVEYYESDDTGEKQSASARRLRLII